MPYETKSLDTAVMVSALICETLNRLARDGKAKRKDIMDTFRQVLAELRAYNAMDAEKTRALLDARGICESVLRK